MGRPLETSWIYGYLSASVLHAEISGVSNSIPAVVSDLRICGIISVDVFSYEMSVLKRPRWWFQTCFMFNLGK